MLSSTSFSHLRRQDGSEWIDMEREREIASSSSRRPQSRTTPTGKGHSSSFPLPLPLSLPPPPPHTTRNSSLLSQWANELPPPTLRQPGRLAIQPALS